ncbi:TetR/AcrR family transcriptional regulator [Oscillatoria sp. FACHB-1407]|uniref:TetR/AcrR family transcriptional regulator n=1 Tax=Oscillatoria sp. FACHB-1407 TaxID=2692847 RepID=UPI001684DA4A|nr:TetR/AcrR family transcriptional regulator [Oscillatoria sp. FACHB-1407]MBD2463059.1 TetR/AcrR family transcriptional regulator [Oscillatoria sp. FACHB-1407]
MKTRGTKSRIIETAIELFNQHGTQAVSTNHIAEAMKISPGNLYYHFKNKQEIIRLILEQMISLFDGGWTSHPKPSLANLQDMLSRSFFLLWEYRFFHRELIALLNADPELKKRYRTIRRQRLIEIESFCRGLIESGVLRSPNDPKTLTSITKIIWLISDYWLAFLDLEDEVISPETVEEAINLIIQVMLPYLSDAALHELSTSAQSTNLPKIITMEIPS